MVYCRGVAYLDEPNHSCIFHDPIVSIFCTTGLYLLLNGLRYDYKAIYSQTWTITSTDESCS